MDKRSSFLEKKRRGGVEKETTMSAGVGPSNRRPRAPGIEKNRNAKRCRNWICVCAGKMAAKRETTMSAGEEPSGGGVNPMPKTRVLDWILSDSDEGPSNGKEERAGEGAAKWANGLPHVCEHKCLHLCGQVIFIFVDKLSSSLWTSYLSYDVSFVSKDMCVYRACMSKWNQ
jgi:hypothetical protein